MDWQEELISLYVKISKIYQQKLTGYWMNIKIKGEVFILWRTVDSEGHELARGLLLIS